MDQDAVELLAPLVLQSPPGQIDSVAGDIASILALSSHDAPRAFEARLPALLAQHNEEQLVVVNVPAGTADVKEAGQLIISKEARVGEEEQRYRYPSAGVTLAIDHRTLKASEARPLRPNATVEPLRSALQRALEAYVRDHYPDGAASVIALPLGDIVKSTPNTPAAAVSEPVEESKPAEEEGEANTQIEGADEKAVLAETEIEEIEAASKQENEVKDSEMKPPVAEVAQLNVEEKAEVQEQEQDDSEVQGETTLVMHVVGNKYNPANFWAGRWRSTYTYTPASAGVVQATNRILVHYYENGNVQLRHSRSGELSLSSAASSDEAALAQTIIKAIERQENAYQVELGTTFETLGGEAFKAMRRALPLTKQKMNWDKISTYKLSSEFAQ